MAKLREFISTFRRRDWISMITATALLIWQAGSALIRILGNIDLVVSRIQDPGWLGETVRWVLHPPDWTILPALVLGFLVIGLTLHRAQALTVAAEGSRQAGVPVPAAVIEDDSHQSYIKITNEGSMAAFSGKLTILDSSMFILLEDHALAGTRYDAYWEEAKAGTSRIHKTHYDRIALGTRSFNEAGSVEYLTLVYWDSQKRRKALLQASPISMFPPPEGEKEHSLIVELHLAAEPELPAAWKKTYRITPTTVTEIEASAEDPEAGYTVGRWAGHDNYECKSCPYATLDEEAMKTHVRWKHKAGRA